MVPTEGLTPGAPGNLQIPHSAEPHPLLAKIRGSERACSPPAARERAYVAGLEALK